jgi:acyl-coenzyme A thioesterase PaaI-like protein
VTRPLEIPPNHGAACWGCGDNPLGLRLHVPDEEGAKEYESYLHLTEHHQGAPGLVHGGVVAAALDEACGLLATWYRFPCVTARLGVEYRRPVPIETELLVRARVADERGRHVEVRGELVEGTDTLAVAHGTWVHVPLEHFLGTPEGRAAGEAWRQRLGGA